MKEDPRSAISKFIGEELVDSFTIKVVEPDPGCSMIFMLAPFKDELSEDEIGSFSGGVLGRIVTDYENKYERFFFNGMLNL